MNDSTAGIPIWLSFLFLLAIPLLPLYLILGTERVIKLLGVVAGAVLRFIGNIASLLFNVVRDSGRLRPSTWRISHSGVLVPGDPPVPANRLPDYLDYRGTARSRELTSLAGSGVSLGHFLDPRGGRGGALSLPIDLLQRNCAVIGPPGSGKTEGVVIPWIRELLCQNSSVVTCDVKGDLIDRIEPEARRMGVRLWYWNSTDVARSQSWNWFAGLTDHRDIEAATQSILGRPRPNDSQPFFYERDYRWLRTLIGMVKTAYRHTAVPRYLYSLLGDQTALRNLFKQCPAVQPQATTLADLLQFSVDEHSRAVSGLLNSLHLFNTAPVIQVTERSDFSLADITQAPTLLVVGASLADARAGEVMSGMMLNQLFNVVYRRFSGGGPSVVAPLYFIIDEAPRLKDRINYEEVLSVARSAKVGVCLAAQDVNQFGDQSQQTAILANCLTFIALRGSSPDTARYLSSRLGHRHAEVLSTGRARGPFDIFNQQVRASQTMQVAVLGEREIMHPPGPTHCGIVQIAPVSGKPFLVDLGRP